ncbi:MAG TPA: outer membrane beta-barrel protein [Balneolaceae bacterium]|nr:outer membrane beta-barrel protein [Balneolaceae bacterium]
MKKKLILLTLFMGGLTFAASAQSAADRASIKNTFGIGPRVGYYNSADADDGSFYGGLQARLRLGAFVGIEGAVEYRSKQEYGIGDYTMETSSIPVTASLMLFAPISEQFAPYAVGGLGAYHTRYSFSDEAEGLGLEDDNEFHMGYHVGLGFEIPLSSNVALNADYRYLFMNPDRNEESLEDTDFSGNVISAGLMFYF